ncbi:serine hydrolase domain-containing protein [Saccharothrix obliqua]|uniref:serine hydrolase domain-containing protein n=1 Tax=Saccharothrix obliqua TaxID=2861747 RepID=UPI001C5D0ABE|nr:serine hydrolase domain-containing protein [Saccharothrix obliqua]MBW4720615.1 beta-lactamase family protein [Saccharothrix obliqua]
MKHVWTAATALALALAPVTAFADGTTEIDRYVAEFADAAAYRGVAVAVTRGDRVVHLTGHGTTSTGAPVTPTTRMPIASVSKSFTALAAVQLVERGRLDLDVPVSRYLPDFQPADPRGAAITTRHLLNQTSGITDRTLPEKSLPQPRSLADAVIRARSATLAVDPGTKHYYTNTNYHLAARVVEVVSGEKYADYLRHNIFEPAGMRSTTTVTTTPDDLPPDVAKGYVYAYGMSIPAAEPTRFVAGSDDVITTAEDMAKWLVVQQNNGRTADGTALVSPEGIKAMHTSSDPRWTYGMGWDTRDDRVRHNGIWFTHTAGQLLLPSGYGIAVLTNAGVALGNEGTPRWEDGLAEVVQGGHPTASSPRLYFDLVLAALTLFSLYRGIRNLRRRTVPKRWVIARLVPRVVPAVLLFALPGLSGLLMSGGRDLTLGQLAHYSPALVIWVATAAVLNLAVLGVRVHRITVAA